MTHPSTHPAQCHLPVAHNLCIFTSIHSSAIYSSTYIHIYSSTHYLLTIIPSICISVCPLIQASLYSPVHLFAHLFVICSSSAHLPTIYHSPVELLDHLSINLTPPTCPLIYNPYLLYLFSGLSICRAVCLPGHPSIRYPPSAVWSSIYPLSTIRCLVVPPFAQTCVPCPLFHSPFTC